MNISDFRALTAPAFLDPEKFPDGMVQFWLNKAGDNLRPLVWKGRLDEGTLYWTAHHILLNARMNAAAAKGAGGGSGSGLVASKSVGGASISYDNSATISKDAGTYNLTAWGQQFWQLARMVGMGVVQVSPDLYGGRPSRFAR